MAHDWGGAISWQLVIESPELVSKFVVMNCPHPAAFAEVAASDWTQILRSWLELMKKQYFISIQIVY